MLSALLFFIMNPGFQFTPEDAGIYKAQAVPIYKLEKNFVFLGFSDRTLALVSPTGEVIKTYIKEGSGPGELQTGQGLGVRDNHLYLYTNQRVLAFDKSLNFLKDYRISKDSVPNTLAGIFSGKYYKNDRFLIGLTFAPEMLVELKVGKEAWHMKTLATVDDFHRQFSENVNAAFAVTQRPEYIFTYKTVTEEDNYQVYAYKEKLPERSSDDSNTVIMLQNDISDFDIVQLGGVRAIRVAIGRAFDTPDGFIVDMQYMNKNGGMSYHQDFFDKTGTFVKRVRDSDIEFLPVINSSEVFALHTDENGDETILQKYP